MVDNAIAAANEAAGAASPSTRMMELGEDLSLGAAHDLAQRIIDAVRATLSGALRRQPRQHRRRRHPRRRRRREGRAVRDRRHRRERPGAGIAAGIDAGTPFVEQAAKDAVKAAEKAARKEAKAESPSRVFAAWGVDRSAKRPAEATRAALRGMAVPAEGGPDGWRGRGGRGGHGRRGDGRRTVEMQFHGDMNVNDPSARGRFVEQKQRQGEVAAARAVG